MSALHTHFSTMLDVDIVAAKRVSGGRNSRVWRLEEANGRLYAGKEYYLSPDDPRDRLGTEFSSLQFLHANGLDNVPTPLASAPKLGLAAYNWIENEQPGRSDFTSEDIRRMGDFLIALKGLAAIPEARALPAASAACFSGAAAMQGVYARLERLHGITALAPFLGDTFLPLVDRVESASRTEYAQYGMDFEAELPQSARTLSPSDFGTHNALRTESGLVFLDFEFFGWDDPAKMACDFLLHPGMDITADLRADLVSYIAPIMDDNFLHRVRALYSVFGLQWILIMLNEFAPGDMARRSFANGNETKAEDSQAEQLAKAAALAQRIDNDGFPFEI